MMQNEKNVTENHGGNMGEHGETRKNFTKIMMTERKTYDLPERKITIKQ